MPCKKGNSRSLAGCQAFILSCSYLQKIDLCTSLHCTRRECNLPRLHSARSRWHEQRNGLCEWLNFQTDDGKQVPGQSGYTEGAEKHELFLPPLLYIPCRFEHMPVWAHCQPTSTTYTGDRMDPMTTVSTPVLTNESTGTLHPTGTVQSTRYRIAYYAASQ